MELLPTTRPDAVTHSVDREVQLGLGQRQYAVLAEQQEVKVGSLIEADVRHGRRVCSGDGSCGRPNLAPVDTTRRRSPGSAARAILVRLRCYSTGYAPRSQRTRPGARLRTCARP